MSMYTISFFKRILSSDGHPFTCLQEQVQVSDAESSAQAAVKAMKLFESQHRIPRWDCWADSFDVREVEAPPLFNMAAGAADSAAAAPASAGSVRRSRKRAATAAPARARVIRRDDGHSGGPAL